MCKNIAIRQPHETFWIMNHYNLKCEISMMTWYKHIPIFYEIFEPCLAIRQYSD